MSAIHDMTLRQGNTFRRRMRFVQFGSGPVDLTGSVVTVTIGAGSSPVRKSSADGSLRMVSAVSGEIEILLTAADTRELALGLVPYEVERAILDQRTDHWDETTLLTGSIVVQRGLNDER